MKKLVLFLLLIVTTSNLFGQELPNIISQTPEAAALSKYSEYPVGTFTGVPSINVPLYTINSGDISFPINLNYHAGGFRVSEESSWVGLGWTLSANAIITRSVNGVEDFNGSMASSITPYHSAPKIVDITLGQVFPNSDVPVAIFEGGIGGPFGNPGSNGFMGHYMTFAYSRFRSDIANVDDNLVNYNPYKGTSFDWEPDIYSINVLNHNGKFVFDQEQNIHFLEKKDIEINRNEGNWVARTNDGFEYYFESKEASENFYGREVNGTWYLTKIISPSKREMNFTYEEAENTSIQYSYSEYADVLQSTPSEPTPFFVIVNPINSTHFTKKYLKRIDFDEGYVLFTRDTSLREDLKNAERLKKIEIYDLNNSLIKEFEFETSYFNSNDTTKGYFKDLFSNDTEYSCYTKRLKLDKVIERKGTESKEYEFKYSSLNLPNKDSFEQDHWGYYNGIGSNSLIPDFKGELTFKYRNQGQGNQLCIDIAGEYPSRYFYIDGTNRESDHTKITANILEEIIYPTKGNTSFEFEGNEFGNLDDIEEEFLYEHFTKDIRLLSYSNQPNIIQSSVNFPINFPSDAVEIYDPEIELVVYPTGPNNVHVSSNMVAKFRSATIDRDYYFNDVLTPSNNYLYKEELPLFPADNSIFLNDPISLELLIPEMDRDQTAIFTFKCKLKRKNLTIKKDAGGVRVKKITHYDGVNHANDIIKTYDYNYTSTTPEGVIENKTYGILKNPIKYYYLAWNTQFCSSYFKFFSSNKYALSYSQNSHIGYSKVIEKIGLNGELGKIVYDYTNFTNDFHTGNERPLGVPNSISKRYDGKLKKKSIFNDDDDLVSEEINSYAILDEKIIKGVYQDGFIEPFIYGSGFYGNGGMHYYPIFSRWEALFETKQRTYNLNSNSFVETVSNYQYNPENLLPSEISTADSKGNTIITKNYYSNDVLGVNALGEGLTVPEYNAINQLKKIKGNGEKGDYKTSQPIQVETYKNSNLISRQRTNYRTWDNNGLTLPEFVQISKGENDLLENRIQYKEYDEFGNPIKISKTGGPDISYIWGYNSQYPIAKIENVPLSGFNTTQQGYINTATSISNNENTLTTENSLRTALKNLRESFSNSMVSTYTYDPLIGVTSVTDPKGYSTYYEYDELNRLKFVKDDEGKLVSENKYHYKD